MTIRAVQFIPSGKIHMLAGVGMTFAYTACAGPLDLADCELLEDVPPALVTCGNCQRTGALDVMRRADRPLAWIEAWREAAR